MSQEPAPNLPAPPRYDGSATNVGEDAQGSIAQHARRPWNMWLVGLVAVLVVLAAVGVAVALQPGFPTGGSRGPGAVSGSDSATVTDAGTFTVQGTLRVTGCSSAGYDDIYVGSEMRIVDGAGETLAVGAIDGERSSCLFTFRIENVPIGEKFYEIRITHRGGPTYTEEELTAGTGDLELSLG